MERPRKPAVAEGEGPRIVAHAGVERVDAGVEVEIPTECRTAAVDLRFREYDCCGIYS